MDIFVRFFYSLPEGVQIVAGIFAIGSLWGISMVAAVYHFNRPRY